MNKWDELKDYIENRYKSLDGELLGLPQERVAHTLNVGALGTLKEIMNMMIALEKVERGEVEIIAPYMEVKTMEKESEKK